MKRAHSPRLIEAWMIVKDPVKLRRARKDAGLTQVALARRVNITQQYISLLESTGPNGDKDCSEKIAERICRELGVRHLEDLFEERREVRTPVIATRSRGRRNVA